jgi:hypothetical protein
MTFEPQSSAVASTEWSAYEPRLFVDLDILTERHWTVKLYGIHHDITRDKAALIDPAVLQSGRMQVCGLLAEADRVGAHHNTGFVILHQGKQANWLLTHWWIQQNVCCHIVLRSPLDDPARFVRPAAPITACVWELVIIDFERRAWVATALQAKPAFNAYLAARLPDGTY